MYTFNDKGGRSITLKPEGTAGVVRSFVESGLCAGPQPNKMYYLSTPIFRYENPQAGRLREHHQFGVEVFGAPDPSADAEIIALALKLFGKLGIENLKLNINSIGCEKCRPEYKKALISYLSDHKSELCGNCLERMERNPLRVLDCKVDGCKKVAEGAPRIVDYLCDECQEHFSGLKRYLSALGIEFEVNPLIVRGLDYYTKTVFEIISDNIGAQGTVCGGGRYDKLVKEIGGPDMAGVGFGLGIERLLLVMENCGIEIPEPVMCDIYIAPLGDEAALWAFKAVNALRDAGIKADTDHVGRSMKAQMKFADKLGARYMCAVGDTELDNGRASLRCMQDGSETEADITDINGLIEFFKKGNR